MAFDPANYQAITVKETPIAGLLELTLIVHGDSRGWFKENYQQEKMEAMGLPHFEVVQNNVSFNAEKGVTRGLHAEPWEKFVTVATGSVFCAWVDLRKGPDFGKTFTLELNPGKAAFVPKGIANGYQTLEPNSVYTYLVNDYWTHEATYTMVNAFDPVLNIAWPVAKEHAIVSDKDAAHPLFKDVVPIEL